MPVTLIIGGTNANEFNGGGFEASGSMTWDNAQGLNGAALHTLVTGCTVDNNGGLVRLNKVGGFTGGAASAYLDIYAFVDFSATYTDDRYRIVASDDDSITLDLAWSTSVPTAITSVGGAVKDDGGDAEQVLDIIQQAAAGDTIKQQGDITTDRELACTVIATKPNRITWLGVDSDGVEVEEISDAPNIIADGVGANDVVGITGDYWIVRKLHIDGNSDASYSLRADTASYNVWIDQCEMSNSTAYGVVFYGDMCTISNCLIHDNGSYGIYSYNGTAQNILYNKIYNHSTYGIRIRYPDTTVIGNLIYNNGTDGIEMYSSGCDYVKIINNTIVNHTNGISWGSNSDVGTCINNLIAECTTGIKWLDTTDGYDSQMVITHNNGYDNTADTSHGTWATLGKGENFSLDPRFDANYRPTNTKLLYSGKPDAEGNPTPIGASHPIQPSPHGPQSLVGSAIGAF